MPFPLTFPFPFRCRPQQVDCRYFVSFDYHKIGRRGQGFLNGFQQLGKSAVTLEQTLGAPRQRTVRRHLSHRRIGKNDDGNIGQARVGVHEFEHIGSADLGQHQVQQDQIRGALGEQIEGGLPVCRAYKVKALALQSLLIHGLGYGIVLNKENCLNANASTCHGSKCISTNQLCGESAPTRRWFHGLDPAQAQLSFLIRTSRKSTTHAKKVYFAVIRRRQTPAGLLEKSDKRFQTAGGCRSEIFTVASVLWASPARKVLKFSRPQRVVATTL